MAQLAPGQQYLNPGAWFDGFRYAVATETARSSAPSRAEVHHLRLGETIAEEASPTARKRGASSLTAKR